VLFPLDLGRLTRGEAIAAGSALVLFVVMFLPWFSEDAPIEIPGVRTVAVTQETHNAWQAFAFNDVLLLLVILLTLGVTLVRAAGLAPSDAPLSLAVTAAGLFAVILILYRLADPPGPTIELSVGEPDVGRRVGIVLGLVAATGISLGGYLALSDRRR
jgi:hypothetical protein